MKIKILYSLLFCGLFVFALLSCGSDDDDKPKCDTFSTADSACFCKAHPEDLQCITPVCDIFSKADSVCFCTANPTNASCIKPVCDTFSKADSVCFCTANPGDANCILVTSVTISLFTEEQAALTPHPSNGTLWTKGFVIDQTIYLIDRESDSPHAFLKFDVEENDVWEEMADFPGTGYGLTGSANGKGYASSYASVKFWEYNPTTNQWTPLADLPFSTGETHWVEYEGKFYVPDNDGIYEFNATTQGWTKISNQVSSGFGAIFLIDADMYWWDINNDYMSHFNLATKTFDIIDLPNDFGSNITFNSPFVLGNVAYIVSGSSLWVFNNTSKTWAVNDEIIEDGSAYPDDSFVIDNTTYLVDNGYLMVFDVEE